MNQKTKSELMAMMAGMMAISENTDKNFKPIDNIMLREYGKPLPPYKTSRGRKPLTRAQIKKKKRKRQIARASRKTNYKFNKNRKRK